VRTTAHSLALALLLLGADLRAQEDDLLWLGDEDEPTVEAVPVVTGLRPQSASVLSGEELLRRGYRTLGDALADVVGVDLQRGTGNRRYGMRGVPNGMVLVVDGIPRLIDGERDLLDVDEGLDLADVERVEVVRGPVSAINGVGALSGVVRVTTRRPGLTGGRLRMGLTHLGEREVGGAATGRHGQLALRATLSHRSGPRGTLRLEKVPTRFIRVGRVVLPSTKEDVEVIPEDDRSTLARLTLSAGELRLEGSFTRTDLHMPISSFSHALLDEGPQQRQLRERHGLRLQWTRAVGPVHLDASAYGGRHLRTDRVQLFPPKGIFAEGGNITVDGESATVGGLLRADVGITQNHRLVLGAFGDLSRQWVHTDALDPYDGVAYERLSQLDDLTGTATATAEYQGDFGSGWHLTAGAALEWRTSYGLALAPRAALIYLPLRWLTLRLAYAEGKRAPDRYDLAALTQAVVAGRVVGAAENPELQPEHARTGELAIRLEPSARLQLEADLFATRHENAIEAQIVGARLVPANLDPRLVLGGELMAAVEVLPSLLTLAAGASLARTVDGPLLENRLLTLLASGELTPLDGLALGARGRGSLREGDDVASGAVALVDLYASYRLAGELLRVRAAVLNATDARELSLDPAALAGSSDVAIPSRGRTFTVGVEGRL